MKWRNERTKGELEEEEEEEDDDEEERQRGMFRSSTSWRIMMSVRGKLCRTRPGNDLEP